MNDGPGKIRRWSQRIKHHQVVLLSARSALCCSRARRRSVPKVRAHRFSVCLQQAGTNQHRNNERWSRKNTALVPSDQAPSYYDFRGGGSLFLLARDPQLRFTQLRSSRSLRCVAMNRGNSGRFGEIRGDSGRFGEIRGNSGKFGEIRGNSGGLGGDSGARARRARAGARARAARASGACQRCAAMRSDTQRCVAMRSVSYGHRWLPLLAWELWLGDM